jgi:hypothetical protein
VAGGVVAGGSVEALVSAAGAALATTGATDIINKSILELNLIKSKIIYVIS